MPESESEETSPRRRLAFTSRRPQNPDKKQKIFGYNAVLSTSVELHLRIELPVAITNIAGNALRDVVSTRRSPMKTNNLSQTKTRFTTVTTLRQRSISLTPSMTPWTISGISGIIALYLSLTITQETKTCQKRLFLIEDTTRMDGPLPHAACLQNPTALIRSTGD